MRATDFVHSYFDAWNHHDPKAVADHLASDGIYCDIPENSERSRDELIVSLGEFFATNQHRYELIGEFLSSGHTIAFQYRMCPPGSSAFWCGAEFISLHGDAAMSITDYYDMPGTAQRSHPGGLADRTARASKYAKSGLGDEQLREYRDRLGRFMQSKQAYLRPDLTLPVLAKAVGCSVNHLSQVINAGFGMSFFDFLNHYRVEHAKYLLTRPGRQGGAVLSIAYQVGFGSNSAFYVAFKKYVGQTPTQYRQTAFKQTN